MFKFQYYVFTVLIMVLSSFVLANKHQQHASKSMAEPEKMAVITFNATLPPNRFLLPGEGLYKNILNWTDTQINDLKSEALQFFTERFGIKQADKHPDFQLMFIQTNPQANLRCVMLSGDDYIPPHGFRVFDGGFIALVKNVKGAALGGDFQGSRAVFGQTFSLGHMYIERVDQHGNSLQPYIWKQRHSSPGAVATMDRGQTTNGELEVETVSGANWGTGSSLSVTKYHFDEDGIAHAVLRNFYTF